MQYMACICGPLHYSAVPVHAPPEVPLTSTLCTAALLQFKQQEPCRAVSLSVGEGLLAFTTDAFMGTQSMIHIAKLEQDIEQQSSKSILSIEAPKGRITRVFWSELNRALVTSHDGGFLRKWDSEVGGGEGLGEEEGREGLQLRPASSPNCEWGERTRGETLWRELGYPATSFVQCAREGRQHVAAPSSLLSVMEHTDPANGPCFPLHCQCCVPFIV